jgi:biotin operon repressor
MGAIDYKSNPTRLLHLLNQATNISAESLAFALKTTKRGVREIVHTLREQRHLICSGDNGYYMAQSMEEFERFEAREMSSINSRLNPLRVMRKTAEQQWGKQKELFNEL